MLLSMHLKLGDAVWTEFNSGGIPVVPTGTFLRVAILTAVDPHGQPISLELARMMIRRCAPTPLSGPKATNFVSQLKGSSLPAKYARRSRSNHLGHIDLVLRTIGAMSR